MIQYYEDGDIAIFNDLVFRRDKRTGYFLNAKTHKRLHVCVWEYYNGTVPKGYHVHHKDFDKSNNEIDNLELMTAKEHLKLHGASWGEARYNQQLDILSKKAIPKASEWHKSQAGREWHKKHYENMKDRLHSQETFICEECGKEFKAVKCGSNKFCSNACRAANRRKRGVDNETRICEWCGKEFVTNKYSKAKTCCRSCRNFLRWNKGNPEKGLR